MELREYFKGENILFAVGHECIDALKALQNNTGNFKGGILSEPYFDPVLDYGNGNRYSKGSGESFQEYLSGLLKKSGWDALPGIAVPVAVVKRVDTNPFGQTQAEALFNGLKSLCPGTPSALLLHTGDDGPALMRAEAWVKERGGGIND